MYIKKSCWFQKRCWIELSLICIWFCKFMKICWLCQSSMTICFALLQKRVWQRDYRDLRALEPDSLYAREVRKICYSCVWKYNSFAWNSFSTNIDTDWEWLFSMCKCVFFRCCHLQALCTHLWTVWRLNL